MHPGPSHTPLLSPPLLPPRPPPIAPSFLAVRALRLLPLAQRLPLPDRPHRLCDAPAVLRSLLLRHTPLPLRSLRPARDWHLLVGGPDRAPRVLHSLLECVLPAVRLQRAPHALLRLHRLPMCGDELDHHRARRRLLRGCVAAM